VILLFCLWDFSSCMRVSGGRRVRFQVSLASYFWAFTIDWVGTRVPGGGALGVTSISFPFGLWQIHHWAQSVRYVRGEGREKRDD